jgi:hypothetical protein
MGSGSISTKLRIYHERSRTFTNNQKIPEYKFVVFVWFVVRFKKILANFPISLYNVRYAVVG